MPHVRLPSRDAHRTDDPSMRWLAGCLEICAIIGNNVSPRWHRQPVRPQPTQRVAAMSGDCRPAKGVFALLLILAANLVLVACSACVFLGGEGRSSGNVLFASSGRINASAFVMTVKDSATITAAAQRAASAAAETPPFHFSTSQRTCICSRGSGPFVPSIFFILARRSFWF